MIPNTDKSPFEGWLLGQFEETFHLGQVIISRQPRLQLCHEKDFGGDHAKLKKISLSELRSLAQSSAKGEFRPLKSAPDLCDGWLMDLGANELELAMNTLYPGALADLYRFKTGDAALFVTPYRAFTSRQTGMYRISTQLTDQELSPVMDACCDNRVCLKTRLWDINQPRNPSLEFNIPCFEPCALLLEFARKSARMNDKKAKSDLITNGDLETIQKALNFTLSSITFPKVADFSDDTNERRLLLASAKIKSALGK